MPVIRHALFAAMLGGAALAGAVQPGPMAITPEARWFKLGRLQLAALHDGGFVAPNDGKTFGADVTPADVAKVLGAAGAPTDTIEVSVNALLVKLPGHVVLLDTGLGPMAKGSLVASLAAAGIAPDAVTDVLITHSHGDHVGGLATADGKPAFPTAAVRMAAAEWSWMQANQGAAALVTAIAAQVKTFAPGAVVVPGIRSVAIDGHTPGHVGYEVMSGSDRLLDIGDTAHSTIVSLGKPDWAMGFDNDKAQGKLSRRATLTRLARSRELVFAPHFPFPGVGRIAASGDGFRWEPATLPPATR